MANTKSIFRTEIENFLLSCGYPLGRRNDFVMYNDKRAHGIKRLKWYGVRVNKGMLNALQKACKGVPGIVEVSVNRGRPDMGIAGWDLCIFIDRPLRDIIFPRDLKKVKVKYRFPNMDV